MASLKWVLLACLLAVTLVADQRAQAPRAQESDAEKWVQATLENMTIEEKVGQMIVSSFQSNFLSSDSATYDELVKAVHEYHVGGFHVFGASEAAPPVLLNAAYGTVTLGQPLAAASTFNRLQAIAKLPLLNTADFEGGVGFRIMGATAFPRLMTFGAARDEKLAEAAGRVTGRDGHAANALERAVDVAAQAPAAASKTAGSVGQRARAQAPPNRGRARVQWETGRAPGSRVVS